MFRCRSFHHGEPCAPGKGHPLHRPCDLLSAAQSGCSVSPPLPWVLPPTDIWVTPPRPFLSPCLPWPLPWSSLPLAQALLRLLLFPTDLCAARPAAPRSRNPTTSSRWSAAGLSGSVRRAGSVWPLRGPPPHPLLPAGRAPSVPPFLTARR